VLLSPAARGDMRHATNPLPPIATKPDLPDRAPGDGAPVGGRIFQLERWGARIISKIQTRVCWKHDVNGPQEVTGSLGGVVDTSTPWQFAVWFGGWDGDLLIGYARETLKVPFQPG